MTINSFTIVERSIYEGVLMGLGKISANAGQMAPEQVADVLHRSIMDELQLVINFDNQPLDLMAAAQQLIDEYEMSQNPSSLPDEQQQPTTSNDNGQ
ncbi:MAG: hypothetical protein EBU46_00840 [Nitrosomonadaceae bacterium]|nr:hypothetical protein [Nitrosomonadaceae bacterium]